MAKILRQNNEQVNMSKICLTPLWERRRFCSQDRFRTLMYIDLTILTEKYATPWTLVALLLNFHFFFVDYDGKRRRLVCVKKPLDLVTDFWFASRILWKFSKMYVTFLDFVLSCINCTRSAWTENPRNFFRKSAIFSKCWLTPSPLLDDSAIVPHGNQLLKTTKRLRIFSQIIFVYSDG